MAYKFQKGLAVLSGAIAPMADGEFDLGTSTKEYKDIYIDGIAYFDQLGTDADPTTAYISGGEVDGAVIGSETPAAGSFTTLTSTGTLVMPIVTAGHILVADGTSYQEVAMSGDATISSAGALTLGTGVVETAMIAADAVTAAKIGDDAVGADQLAANAVVNASIASGAAIDLDKLDGGSCANSLTDLADGDLMYAGDITDSNNIKSITFGNLEDAIFGNVGGDATIAAGGTLTIGTGVVETAMLANDAVDADKLASNAVVNASVASAAAIAFSKMENVASARLIVGNGSNVPTAVDVTGDVTISNTGVTTIGTTKVTDAMLNDDVATGLAGVGLGASGGAMTLEFSELPNLAQADIEVNEDYIAIMESDGNVSRKMTMADYATSIAGAGLTATNGVLSSDASPAPTNHGDSNATLVEGMNYSNATFTAARTWTLPGSPDNGDIVSVKAPSNADAQPLTVLCAGSHTADGNTQILLTSPYAAVEFVYAGSNLWLIK